MWSGPCCELYCHPVCTWKLWNLPILWFVYERIRLKIINPRVLKIERGLYVKMLDFPLLRFDRERMQLVYEVILLNKILSNHFLPGNLQWNCASFSVTLNYLMYCTRSWNFAWHLLWHSPTEGTNIVKHLAISQAIFTVYFDDDYFSKGKFKLFNSLFHSVYLVFPISLFSVADLFAVRHLWSYVTKMNTVLWRSARQTFASLGLFTFARIACLLQLWIKKSELDNFIWATPIKKRS